LKVLTFNYRIWYLGKSEHSLQSQDSKFEYCHAVPEKCEMHEKCKIGNKIIALLYISKETIDRIKDFMSDN